MATPLAEGIYPCTVVNATFGDNDKGIPTAQINVRLDSGANATYEDRVDARSALYVGRSLKAVGWAGKDLSTVAADCDAWIKKTGGKTTAEIKHIPYKDKKTGEEKIWAKCNAIGRGAQPLSPPKQSSVADANEAMARVFGDDTSNDQQPANDDSLPF